MVGELKMLVRDLTLFDFKNFIVERIFQEIDFHYSYDEYLEKFDNNRNILFDYLFKYRIERKCINSFYRAHLVFGLQIEKSELQYYSSIDFENMFREFIELKKLEDIKSFDVYTSYNSNEEYAFDFDFTIWIKKY